MGIRTLKSPDPTPKIPISGSKPHEDLNLAEQKFPHPKSQFHGGKLHGDFDSVESRSTNQNPSFKPHGDLHPEESRSPPKIPILGSA